MPLATVINYCTNDFRFLGKCIEGARKFSAQIVIPVCDHFFDGTAENRPLLDATYAQFPDCTFLEFAYLPDRLYSLYHSSSSEDDDWPCYWAATARHIGFQFLAPQIDTVLFLDADEIVEGERFAEWLQTEPLLPAQRLAAYLYVLRPTLCAQKVVNLSLLVQRETFAPLTLFNPLERIGAYKSHPGPKREQVVGLDGKPLIHHYSWVRTKEECLQKARTWSHRADQDWPTLIERAFAGDLTSPFDIPLAFEEIDSPYFDPFFPHVKKVTPRVLLQREIGQLL